MVNKCCVPGCQSHYKKKDVECKYVPIFSFPKKEDLPEMNGKGKYHGII